MPGEWVDLPSQVGGTEQLSFHMTGLSGNTSYEAQFSDDAEYPDDDTHGVEFRTLGSIDRTLSVVTVNGDDLVGWNYTTTDEFTTSVTFAAFSGTVTVSALASSASAVVDTSPVITEDARSGDSIQVTITVTNGGADRVYTLVINVVAYRLGNYSLHGGSRDIAWAPELDVFFVSYSFSVFGGSRSGVRAYSGRGVLLHTYVGVASGGIAWANGRLWLGTTYRIGGRNPAYMAFYHMAYTVEGGFGAISGRITPEASTVPYGVSRLGSGMEFRNGRLWRRSAYVAIDPRGNSRTHLFSFTLNGTVVARDEASDVNLGTTGDVSVDATSVGLAWDGSRWRSVDTFTDTVRVWNADGSYYPAGGYRLDPANSNPTGIVITGGTHQNATWVVDSSDNIAYAYDEDGTPRGSTG